MTGVLEHGSAPPRLVAVLQTMAAAPGTYPEDLVDTVYDLYCTGGRPVPRHDPGTGPHVADALGHVLGDRGWREGAAVLAAGGPPTGDDLPPRVRFYWNLADPAPLRFVPQVRATLDRVGISYVVKYLPRPSWRADRVALYVERDHYHLVRRVLEPLVTAFAPALRHAVPLCAHELAPGWATAEDPTGVLSFGEDRALLIAETLRTARSRGDPPTGVLRTAVEVFAARGVSLGAAHLARYSVADYTAAPRRARGIPRPAAEQDDSADGYLRQAASLAGELASRALWSGDRCTWLEVDSAGMSGCTTRPIGPDLGAGAAGIALTLCRVATATQDRVLAETARSAIRQALARAEDIPPHRRLGLFAGWAGVAGAALTVGRGPGDESLVEAGIRLLTGLRCAWRPGDGAGGLVAGGAGSLLTLAGQPELLRDPRFAGWAHDLAAVLLSRASRDPAVVAHGAGGEALALAEFGAAVGDGFLLRVAAERAAGLPPDDRMCWCHGATGLGAVHLRMFRHLGGAAHRARAVDAVGAALASARAYAARAVGTLDVSLGHGVGGPADTALLGAEVLGDDTLREAARRLAGRIELPMGPGAEGQQHPGLLAGLAGVTLLRLRLHDSNSAGSPFWVPCAEPDPPRSSHVES